MGKIRKTKPTKLKDNFNKKLNDGCLKIFNFLELLYQDEATYEKVIELFKDEIKVRKRSNNIQVILNKYINTLKVFGVKIVKEKNKYKLLSSLYSMEMSLDDIKALSILHASIKDFPDANLCEDILKVVNSIEARMSNEDKQTLNSILTNNSYDFSFYYKDWREQIKQCIKICETKPMIKVAYFDKEKHVQIKCAPKEILYDSKSAILSVYSQTKMQNINIPIPDIISIEELPNQANSMEMTQTVVFKLKGRLAQTYHVRANYEHEIDYIQEEGCRFYANSGEPFDSLLSRLMRYQESCEIISPKGFRDKMIELINAMLDNYKDDELEEPTPKKRKRVKKEKEEDNKWITD